MYVYINLDVTELPHNVQLSSLHMTIKLSCNIIKYINHYIHFQVFLLKMYFS